MVTLVCDAPLHSIEIRQSGLIDSAREAVGKGTSYGEWPEVMNENWVNSQPDHGEFQYRHRFEVRKKVFFGSWTALDAAETGGYSSTMSAFCDALTRWKRADDALRVGHRFTLALWRRAARGAIRSAPQARIPNLDGIFA